jgi:zinc/manganese transport system substrate-binding protein
MHRLLPLIVLLAGLFSGRAQSRPLQVVASTTLIADVARQIASNRAEVVSLAGAQADPHAFDPTPAQMKQVLAADVVLLNGAGLEIGLLKAIRDAGGKARIVEVSHGITFRTGPACCPHGNEHAGHDHAEHDHAHDHDDAADPHVWFDPLLVKVWATNITTELSARLPAHAAEFTANRDAATARLDALHQWITDRFATIPKEKRKLVSDHAFLGYFAARYKLDYEGSLIPGTSTLAQPSAKQLAATVKAMRKAGVNAIFTETGSSPRLAETIAKDAKAIVIPLHTCSLGGPGSGAETYLDFMRSNVEAILRGLAHGQP